MALTPGGPCSCWTVGTALHSGHCCFTGPSEAYEGDAVLAPCGHWHPTLTLTDVSAETRPPGETHGLPGTLERKSA